MVNSSLCLCVVIHVVSPSAPGLVATGRSDYTSFDLMITPPAISAICVREYQLIVRRDDGMKCQERLHLVN